MGLSQLIEIILCLDANSCMTISNSDNPFDADKFVLSCRLLVVPSFSACSWMVPSFEISDRIYDLLLGELMAEITFS